MGTAGCVKLADCFCACVRVGEKKVWEVLTVTSLSSDCTYTYSTYTRLFVAAPDPYQVPTSPQLKRSTHAEIHFDIICCLFVGRRPGICIVVSTRCLRCARPTDRPDRPDTRSNPATTGCLTQLYLSTPSLPLGPFDPSDFILTPPSSCSLPLPYSPLPPSFQHLYPTITPTRPHPHPHPFVLSHPYIHTHRTHTPTARPPWLLSQWTTTPPRRPLTRMTSMTSTASTTPTATQCTTSCGRAAPSCN